jgi:hypothetical protein
MGLKVRPRETMLVVCAGVEDLRFEASSKVGLDYGNTSTPQTCVVFSDMI